MTANKLKTLALLALFAIGLAACASDAAKPAAPSVTVNFADETTAARSGGPVIEVKTVNRQPLASAALVGPGGGVLATATGQLEPQFSSRYPAVGPDVGVGVFGGSSSGIGTGVFLGFPIGGYGGANPPPPDIVRSRALILVPDMAAYRRDWQQSVVRLEFGTSPGDVTVAEIPAPAPGGR